MSGRFHLAIADRRADESDAVPPTILVREGIQCEAPSAVSRVNKYFYSNTIGTFYGTRGFVFIFVGKESISFHIERCLAWLSNIGEDCAALLTNLVVIYSKRRHFRDITLNLVPQMHRRGVRGDRGGCTLWLMRVPHPFHCSAVIMQTVWNGLWVEHASSRDRDFLKATSEGRRW